MKYQYIYDQKGNVLEINELNFMVPCSLPPLSLRLLFQNEKYIKEMKENFVVSDTNSVNQGGASVYICYLYACNRFSAYLEEIDEDVLCYKDIFHGLFPRILFFFNNANSEQQCSCIESLKEIEEFKKLPEEIKWIFYLSITEIRSICSGCFKDPQLLLERYRESHKICSHEFNYANSYLLTLFNGVLYSENSMKKTQYTNFWKI